MADEETRAAAPEPALETGELSAAPGAEAGTTRREFLVTAAVGGALLAGGCEAPERPPPPSPRFEPYLEVALQVNGQLHTLRVDARVTLLDALREQLGMAGTKKGCDHGQCGACTVLMDGRRVLSCLTLAAMAEGSEVRTVEGVAQGEQLHPLQEAFIQHDAFQCGYCTPGQLMSALGLMSEPCGSSDEEVRECMSGNLCRCGAYPNIIAAIQQVRRQPLP